MFYQGAALKEPSAWSDHVATREGCHMRAGDFEDLKIWIMWYPRQESNLRPAD